MNPGISDGIRGSDGKAFQKRRIFLRENPSLGNIGNCQHADNLFLPYKRHFHNCFKKTPIWFFAQARYPIWAGVIIFDPYRLAGLCDTTGRGCG